MIDRQLEAGYFDGKSAVEHPVPVLVQTQGLLLRFPSGETASWAFNDLRLVSIQRDDETITFGLKGDTHERLRLSGDGVAEGLLGLVPSLSSERPEKGILKPVLLSAGIVAVLAGLFFSYPLLREAIIMSMPRDWAVSLGESMGAGYIDGAIDCQGEEGIEALENLTDRLIASMDMPYDIRVKVVDFDMVNAFAAPGGHVVLFSGLIDKAENPDEVAGVLGHELGHVLYRHPLERIIDVYGFELLLGGLGGDIGAYGGMLALLKSSRDDEREADLASVEMLTHAGISTAGYADFFGRLKMKRSEGAEIFEYISSHPLPSEREKNVREQEQSQSTTPALTEVEWAAVQEMCKGLNLDLPEGQDDQQ